MNAFDKIASEVFHQAGLIPLVALIVLRLHGFKATPWYWGIAAAFSVSWVADSVAYLLIHNDKSSWIVSYFYPSIQLGIVYVLLLERRLAFFVLGGLGLLCISTLSQGPLDSPETSLRVSNGLFVAALAYQRKDLGLIRTSLIVYFGAGAIFQLAFPLLIENIDLFRLDWYAYQGCRMIGLILNVGGIVANRRPHLTLE